MYDYNTTMIFVKFLCFCSNINKIHRLTGKCQRSKFQGQFLFWIMSTYILAETEEKEGKEGEEDLDNSYWEP